MSKLDEEFDWDEADDGEKLEALKTVFEELRQFVEDHEHKDGIAVVTEGIYNKVGRLDK